jgi:pimeloyl-ACP methyl ester carboxylesterase
METRHWLWVKDRWVHYRRLGAGPAVVLLHGSPQSSSAVGPLMQAVAARGFTAIAPDNPGNGSSDALPGYETDVEAYVQALGALMDRLGLARATFYGFHTGAAHACAFAALHPDRVSGMVLEGLPVWTEAERADLLAHYLPAFTPTPYGEHLTWLWARVEEQAIFFPWHDARVGARMAAPRAPTLEALHANVMDFLRAGDAYRALYASAFVFEGERWAARLGVSGVLTAAPSDPLAAHIARLPALDARLDTKIGPSDRAAFNAIITGLLAQWPGDVAPPAPDSGVDAEGRTRGFFTDGAGAILAYEGPAKARTLFLTDLGESVRAYARAPHLTLDLPGHGEGAASWRAIGDTVDDLAAQTAFVREKAGDLAWSGAGLGGTIATRFGGKSARAIGRDAAPPDLSPRWDGAHLSAAWRYLRRRAMFCPWTSLAPADAREPLASLSPESLHQQTLDLLRAAPHLTAAYSAAMQSLDSAV